MSWARILLATALTVAVATLAVLGAVLPAPGPAGAAGPAPAPGPARAGGVVCPLGDTAEGATLDVVLAVPSDAVAPARATVVALGSMPGRAVPEPLAPGGVTGTRTDVASDGPVWVGWADAPVVVWREWVRPSAPGVPRGRTAGACVPGDATTWHVVGLRTDGGYEAALRLANPFAVDATVAVQLFTAEGSVAPIALQNVSVPAGGVTTIRVNDHVPEADDVAAVVRVEAGRAAVEALQVALAGVGGVDGVALVPAVTAPATAWTLPWIPADEDAWVSVLNPSEREVELELTLHTVDGPGLPAGSDVVTVPAGRTIRVPVADLAAPRAGAVGLSILSPTDPVVVGGGLRIDPGDPAASGIAVLPALPAGDTGWLVAGRSGADRVETLRLVNVDTATVPVRAVLRTADGRTRELGPVELDAGAVGRLDLPRSEDAVWAVEVAADGAVVVARTGLGGPDAAGPGPIAAAGVPASSWRESGAPLVGRRRDGWTRRDPLP